MSTDLLLRMSIVSWGRQRWVVCWDNCQYYISIPFLTLTIYGEFSTQAIANLATREDMPLDGFGIFGVVKEVGVDDEGMPFIMLPFFLIIEYSPLISGCTQDWSSFSQTSFHTHFIEMNCKYNCWIEFNFLLSSCSDHWIYPRNLFRFNEVQHSTQHWVQERLLSNHGIQSNYSDLFENCPKDWSRRISVEIWREMELYREESSYLIRTGKRGMHTEKVSTLSMCLCFFYLCRHIYQISTWHNHIACNGLVYTRADISYSNFDRNWIWGSY